MWPYTHRFKGFACAFVLLLAGTLLSYRADAQQVASLWLVNADTDQLVLALTNGMTVDLQALGTTRLNVVARTTPSTVGSVRFGLDGQARYRTDNLPPYSLAGDSAGNYYAWTPSLGSHVVTATPFSGRNASGTAGPRVRVQFTLVNKPVPTVKSFLLVNADTNQAIGPLVDGQSLNLALLSSRNLNIVAVTAPTTVGSVQFALDGEPRFSLDSVAPYALAGDAAGDYAAWTPAVGTHIVSATPYGSSDGSGTPGLPREIQFTVEDQLGVPTAVVPGSAWATATPAYVGLDSMALDALQAHVGGRGMVVRYGYQAYAWGDIGARVDFASATKAVHTHMLLHAVQSGRIASLDDKVALFEPRLDQINALVGYKDRDMTWRHLANMTSGYGLTEPPGAAFGYNDYAIALYVDTLLLNVYGTTWATADSLVLQPLLGDRIGWQDAPTYNGKTAGRIAISSRDLARFGLLYLNRGDWNGQSLLEPGLVDLATGSPLHSDWPRTLGLDAEMIAGQRTYGGGKNQAEHYGSYSFTWWVNGELADGTRHWPALPVDAYVAHGHWGKRVLLVVPSQQLIVVWNDATTVDTIPELQEAFRLLMDAVH
jgi:hypothetical protein